MVGEKVKRLRSQVGLSQRELAKILDISCSTIAMIESGKREGSKEVLSKIAAFFSVSIDFLYGLEESQPEVKKERSRLIDNFLDDLINEGLIKDLNDIDEEIEDMILNAVKAKMALKLRKKNN